MSLRKSIGLLGALCCAVGVLGPSGYAAESVAPVAGRPLSAMLRNEAAGGAPLVNNIYVTTGTNQMGFGLPEGFRMTAYAQKILLVSPDNSCFLTFRILNSTAAAKGQESAAYRRLILSQFPDARISDESSCQAASLTGTVFNLSWVNSGGGAQSIRMAFVPSPAGVLEVGLVTVAEKFGDDQTFFNYVMSSLRTNARGKLEAATPPGNS